MALPTAELSVFAVTRQLAHAVMKSLFWSLQAHAFEVQFYFEKRK